MPTVTLCQDGVARHDPALPDKLRAIGARPELVECFDLCERCERRVLSRIDGIRFAAPTGDALVAAVLELSEDSEGAR